MVKKFNLYFLNLLNKDNYDTVKIIYLYRYLSWLITSIFYFISGPRVSFIYKFGVSFLLLLAARITTDLYIKNKKNTKLLKYHIFIETIGITILLLSTGGISSPFIWYALNPVLVAASFLPLIFSWINLFFYIVVALFMSYLFFNNEKITFFQLINNNSNNVLVLILINLVVGMLSNLTRKLKKKTKELQYKSSELERVNKMLEKSKESLEENIQNIMSLYQVVEAFYDQDNLVDFLNAFTEYTVKLTKEKAAFFWMMPYENKDSLIAVNNIESSQDKLIKEIEGLWINSKELSKVFVKKLDESYYIMALVKSQARCFGIIGISIGNNCKIEKKKDYTQKLNFIGELSAVILERFHFEEIANKSILVEEQNRIANEIHDSVSQRLFSLTCGVHSVKSHWKSMTEKEISDEFDIISNTAQNAMKELRFAIYGLSYKKRGEKVFEENIKNYISEISSLNNINVNFNIEGDADSISSEIKRVLQRIIYEASGNSIRHGECKNLEIGLEINNDIKLFVIDNGTGFKVESANKGYGLGIYNMKRMVQVLNGKLDVISTVGQGTKINIFIPITT